MTDERGQGAGVETRRWIIGGVIGLVLSLPLAVLFDVISSRTVIESAYLGIVEYDDGRVVATEAHAPPPPGAVHGSGLVSLRFREEHCGRPSVSTIRRFPPTVTILPTAGGDDLDRQMTAARQQAIADELRRSRTVAEAALVETQRPSVERRWGGWVRNALTLWLVCAAVVFGTTSFVAYVREIRGGLRASEGQCPSCGYDLSGHPGGDQCSECGADLPRQARFWAGRKWRDRSRPRR